MGNFGFGARNDKGKGLVQYARYQIIFTANTFFKEIANRK